MQDAEGGDFTGALALPLRAMEVRQEVEPHPSVTAVFANDLVINVVSN